MSACGRTEKPESTKPSGTVANEKETVKKTEKETEKATEKKTEAQTEDQTEKETETKEIHILRVLRHERDWENILLQRSTYTYPE